MKFILFAALLMLVLMCQPATNQTKPLTGCDSLRAVINDRRLQHFAMEQARCGSNPNCVRIPFIEPKLPDSCNPKPKK